MLHSQSIDSHFFTGSSFQVELEGMVVREGKVVGHVVMSILVQSKKICVYLGPRLSTLAPAVTAGPDYMPHVIANWLSSLDFRERLVGKMDRRHQRVAA